MEYLLIFAYSCAVALAFSPNLTQCAAFAVHFFVQQGYRSGLQALAYVSLTEMGIATISGALLFILIRVHLNPYTASLMGSGVLFLLLIIQYKRPKNSDDLEHLPTTISSMGKRYFHDLSRMLSRYVGYLSLFATLAPFSRETSLPVLVMIPLGSFVGSLLFWWAFQSYIALHPELLVRRKLNTMQNTSIYLLIVFILFGIFRIF